MEFSNQFKRLAKTNEFKRAIKEFKRFNKEENYNEFSCIKLKECLDYEHFTRKQIKSVLIAYHKFAVGTDIASPFTLQGSAFLVDKLDCPPYQYFKYLDDKECEYFERTEKQQVTARRKLVNNFTKYCLTQF